MSTFAKEILDINKLYDGFQLASASVREISAQILSSRIPPHFEKLSKFNYYKPEEVKEEFAFVLRELQYSTMLSMLTAVENFIYTDFKQIRSRKKKFRSLKEKHHRITLEQILEVWKYYANSSMIKAIGDLNSALNLRHWLAHGRHWDANVGSYYLPDDILRIGTAILKEIAESSI